MLGKLRKEIFSPTVNFGAFVNLNSRESLITVTHPCLYRKFDIFIFVNGIIFAEFAKFFLLVILLAYGN